MSDYPELRHAVGSVGEQPVRFVEAADHGQKAIPERENAAPLNLGVLVEPAQGLLHRRRPEGLRVNQLALPPADHEVGVRQSPMFDDPLGR